MFLFFFFICFAVVIGAVLTSVGLFSKRNRVQIRIGLLTIGFPFLIMIIITVFGYIGDLLKHKPSSEEFFGEYEIIDASNLNIDKSSYHQYKLILNSDSTFKLTKTPYIDLCESGTYEVDYSNDYNEIAFKCGGYYMAHIDKGFKDHKIEFVIGDPDSRESIYFGKTKSDQKIGMP